MNIHIQSSGDEYRDMKVLGWDPSLIGSMKLSSGNSTGFGQASVSKHGAKNDKHGKQILGGDIHLSQGSQPASGEGNTVQPPTTLPYPAKQPPTSIFPQTLHDPRPSFSITSSPTSGMGPTRDKLSDDKHCEKRNEQSKPIPGGNPSMKMKAPPTNSSDIGQSPLEKTKTSLANTNGSLGGRLGKTSSLLGRLLDIIDNSAVSGDVSSGDLDDFKYSLFQLDPSDLTRYVSKKN